MNPARSLASGCSFVRAHEGTGVLPVLTGSGGTLIATLDPTAQIEPAIFESDRRVRAYRVSNVSREI